jgi:HK97 family phage major capsid protein
VKSVKVLTEERDELAFEAKGIYEAAKRSNRELTEEEDKRFKDITDEKSGLICNLEVKIKEAQEREDAIMAVTKEAIRKTTIEKLDEMTNASTRQRVLPTNGVPADDNRDPSGRIFVRSAKLKAFKNERDAFDSGMWLRAVTARMRNEDDKAATLHCQRNGLQIQNTMSEGTGTGGGYLTPAPLSATLIDVRENVGVARQTADIQPMTSDTLTIPKRNGGLTVYAPGEATALTPSDKTFKQVELITKRRGVLSYISQELTDDALINIVDNVVSEMAYALALQEDVEYINGTGAATTYFGVRGLLSSIGTGGVSTAATGHDTWGEIDMADFTAFMGLLPERYTVSPAFICSSNFYHTVMLRLLASAGGNSISTLQSGAGASRQFLGYPVFVTSQMPTTTAVSTKCCLFGAFNMGVILGDRVGIRIARDDSVGFASDYVALKAVSRYDIRVHEAGTASAAGAYVALSTAS